MNHQRRLNPQIVHDIAAQLFWLLAESAGVEATSEAVIESGGRCLVEAPFSASVLGQYGFDKLSPDERSEACEAIAAEAETFSRRVRMALLVSDSRQIVRRLRPGRYGRT